MKELHFLFFQLPKSDQRLSQYFCKHYQMHLFHSHHQISNTQQAQVYHKEYMVLLVMFYLLLLHMLQMCMELFVNYMLHVLYNNNEYYH